MSSKTVLVLGIFILVLIILNLALQTYSSSCTKTDLINTSIQIDVRERRVIGLNADTDSLKFGIVSPGAIAKRTMKVGYDQEAEVKVAPEGDFVSWFQITPSEFLINNETKEVIFEVLVPENTAIGNYTGKIKFCFKE